jgi:hypothetical protein
MNAIVGKQGDTIGEISRPGNEFGNVSTSNARIQEKTKQTADTTLDSRVAQTLSKGEEITQRVSLFANAAGAFVEKDWGNLAAAGVSFLNEVFSKASIGGKSDDDLGQAVANLKAAIPDSGIQEGLELAVDVLMHPEKNRDYQATSDEDGPKFGKKETLHKIKAELKKLNRMSGPEVNRAKEILTAAKEAVHLKLKMARGAKAAGYAASAASIAVGVAGAVGSCGASLVPAIVDVVASSLDSASEIAQTAIEKTHARAMQQTGGILDGNQTQFKALDPDARLYLGRSHGLAVDVLTHPEKSKGFEGPGGAKFGKKETKRFLGATLSKFDERTKGVTDVSARQELTKVKQDIKKAYDIVSSKLNNARVVKGLKIAGVGFAVTASVVACVATFGAAAPAIPAAIGAGIGALGTAIRCGKIAHELLA